MLQLAVSNIAWDTTSEPDVFKALRQAKVTGIEVAPTKIWPDWVGASAKSARELRHSIESESFSIPALQAILFGKPDLQLFGARDVVERLKSHIGQVCEIASELGAHKLVFGSPKNRDPGDLSEADAWRYAIDTMRSIGDICAEHSVILCVEANPAAYGCKFVTNFRDAARFVSEIASPSVGLHFDTGCMIMAGDDATQISADLSGISYVHISQPNLETFASPHPSHQALSGELARTPYDSWISIEMRGVDGAHVQNVVTACQFAKATYLKKTPNTDAW